MTFSYTTICNGELYLEGPFATYLELRNAVLEEVAVSDEIRTYEFVEALSSEDNAKRTTEFLKADIAEFQKAREWNKENESMAVGVSEIMDYYENRHEQSDYEQHSYIGAY